MRLRGKILVGAATVWLLGASARGEIKTVADHNDNDHATPQFKFEHVPPPARNDAATDATFTVVYGKPDKNAKDVDRLHDGMVPNWEDQPTRNFAFATGAGGRIQVDLGRAIEVAQVNTYSWHPGTRGPQVYKLFGAPDIANNFDPRPGRRIDPLTCGWTLVATVDTRPKKGGAGGQYGVSTFDPAGPLGHYRYLLFDIAPTEHGDGSGNTFYNEIDVIEQGGAKPAPVAAYWSPPARRDPPGDPMDWKPPTSQPAIHPRYDDANYRRLSRAALRTLDLAALRDPSRPVGGVLVTSVDAGGQAAKLDLRPGDILLSLDGISLGDNRDEQNVNDARNGEQQQLTYWSARSGLKTIPIEPGMLGISLYYGQRLLDRYARSSERDPRWDNDMLVATSTFMTDPFLAETALARAIRAGYLGQFRSQLAARIAFKQCRFEEALAIGWPGGAPPQRLTGDSLRMYNVAAMLSFKLEQAIQLSARYPAELPRSNKIAAAVAAYRAMPKSDLANPVAELDNVRRTRFDRYRPFASRKDDAVDRKMGRWGASELNAPRPLSLHVPSGRYFSASLTPAFANVALAAHFNVHDSDQKDTGWEHALTFALFDARRDATPEHSIQVMLTADGTVRVDPFGLPEVQFDLPRADPASRHLGGTIRLVILHNRCEVTLDGSKRIYYGPVTLNESKRRFGFFIQADGVSGTILPPVWERLEDLRGGATTQESDVPGH